MIPDLAQSLGDGRLDAIRRRVLRRQHLSGGSAAAEQVRRRVQQRLRPDAAVDRRVPTTHAQLLQSVIGKARSRLRLTG